MMMTMIQTIQAVSTISILKAVGPGIQTMASGAIRYLETRRFPFRGCSRGQLEILCQKTIHTGFYLSTTNGSNPSSPCKGAEPTGLGLARRTGRDNCVAQSSDL